MKKKPVSVIAALLIAAALALLCACGSAADEAAGPAPAVETPEATPAPTPTPTPTPEPTPEPTPDPVSVTLTGSGPEEVLELMDVENLVYVDAMASSCYPELMQLRAAHPECVIDYTVDLAGVTVGSHDESASIEGKRIAQEELMEKLQYLPELKEFNMCSVGFSNEQSAEIVEAYPDIHIVWTVFFGIDSARSDIKVYSSLHASVEEPRYTTELLMPLFQYCTDLAALDLGHNAISDLEPLTNLKKLKVLILGDNPFIEDISPLAELPELEYLEMFLAAKVTDFSPLGSLTNMKDLNLCYCQHLDDLSFLDNLPELRSFWCRGSGVTVSSPETCQEYIDKYPDVEFLFYDNGKMNAFNGNWRATDWNVAIREAFYNWRKVTVFNGWDDVQYMEGVYVAKGVPIY